MHCGRGLLFGGALFSAGIGGIAGAQPQFDWVNHTINAYAYSICSGYSSSGVNGPSQGDYAVVGGASYLPSYGYGYGYGGGSCDGFMFAEFRWTPSDISAGVGGSGDFSARITNGGSAYGFGPAVHTFQVTEPATMEFQGYAGGSSYFFIRLIDTSDGSVVLDQDLAFNFFNFQYSAPVEPGRIYELRHTVWGGFGFNGGSWNARLLPVASCVPDLTTTGSSNGVPDGNVDVSDYSFYLTLWAAGDAGADVTTTGTSNGVPDGAVDISDFSYYLTLWAAGCP